MSTNNHQSCSKCSNDIPLKVYVQTVRNLLQHTHEDAYAFAWLSPSPLWCQLVFQLSVVQRFTSSRPGILTFSDYYTFQKDGAPAHRARETVELLGNETPDFIPPTFWQSNSPDLNPVDYTIWSVIWESVHRMKLRDIKDLRQRIMQVLDEFDQDSGHHWCVSQAMVCASLCVYYLRYTCYNFDDY